MPDFPLPHLDMPGLGQGSGPGNSGFRENVTVVFPLRRDDLVKFFLKGKSINEKISFRINPAKGGAEDGISGTPIFQHSIIP
jgi:hypothetical protein